MVPIIDSITLDSAPSANNFQVNFCVTTTFMSPTFMSPGGQVTVLFYWKGNSILKYTIGCVKFIDMITVLSI